MRGEDHDRKAHIHDTCEPMLDLALYKLRCLKFAKHEDELKGVAVDCTTEVLLPLLKVSMKPICPIEQYVGGGRRSTRVSWEGHEEVVEYGVDIFVFFFEFLC